MPWNYLFWQVYRFAAPALIAGNTAVLKHASNVPKCALAIENIFTSSGLPNNVFRTLLISGGNTKKILDDDRVHAVTLTGSELAGSKISAAAGKNIKKSVLELGGSDAFIVLKDADLETAVDVGVQARYQNAGQSCIAGKRFILVKEIADEFVERFSNKVARLNVGDPSWANTDIGPMARKDLVDEIHQQVKDSVAKGADLLCGGKVLQSNGYYYPATILDNVKSGMRAYKEELFGPVASVIRVNDADEAISVVNDSPYGLGSSIWSRNINQALKRSRDIQAGATFINEMVKSDPRLPFGGIKKSGYGRELSDFGIKEFVNIKTVYVK